MSRSKRASTARKPSGKQRVKKAAENVKSTAVRARELAQAMISAAALLQQGADFLDSVAQRVVSPTKPE